MSDQREKDEIKKLKDNISILQNRNADLQTQLRIAKDNEVVFRRMLTQKCEEIQQISDLKEVLSEDTDVPDTAKLAWRMSDGNLIQLKDIPTTELAQLKFRLQNQIMAARLQTGETSLSVLTLMAVEKEYAKRQTFDPSKDSN